MNTNKEGGYDMTKETRPNDLDGSTLEPSDAHNHTLTCGHAHTSTHQSARIHTRTHSLHVVVWLLSQVRLFVTQWTITRQAPLSMRFPGKNKVGCYFLLQGNPHGDTLTHPVPCKDAYIHTAHTYTHLHKHTIGTHTVENMRAHAHTYPETVLHK